MKQLKLSNGWKIIVHVGDGFDGGSGVFFKPPENQGHNWNPQNLPVPKKDALRVAKLLNWYARKELELRLYEGTVFVGMGNAATKSRVIGNCSSPYQAVYYAGACLDLAGLRRKAKCFPIEF